jgi:endonuclease-3 related protein
VKSQGQKRLLKIYNRLFKHFGPQSWWPGETQLEICVGAILTQNTAWSNVEKAISNLKKENCMELGRLKEIKIKKLASLIKSSGYFNVKAERLKSFIDYFANHHRGNFKNLFKEKPEDVRHSLLSVKGIGPETADSILLYAGGVPIFVVDTYTKRIFYRLSLIVKTATYDEVQSFFMKNLPRKTNLYNEYHALIVMLGKHYCKPNPVCCPCPLKKCPARKNKNF